MKGSKALHIQDSLFSIIGAFLYIASGSIVIDGLTTDPGLAFGSLSIITGKKIGMWKILMHLTQEYFYFWMLHFLWENMLEEKYQRLYRLT